VKSYFRGFLVANLVLLVFLIGLGAWAIARLDLHAVGVKLASASKLEIAGMALAWLASLFIRPLRLLLLIRATAPEVPRRYWAVWSADLIAMAVNSIIPVRAGDMTMAMVLRRFLGMSTASGFSIVFVDRFFDLATVIVLFVSALSVAPKVAPWAINLPVTLPAGLALLVGGVWLTVRLHKVWLRLLDRLLASMAVERRERWSGRVHDLFEGLLAINKPRVIASALAVSVVLWGMTALSYWLGILAVGSDVPAAAGAFVAGAVALSFVFPAAPGAIGVFHAVTVLALSLFNIPAEAALACAIICHAFQLASVLLLAGVALVSQGLSVRSLATLKESA
jgi:hypothetical protein